MIWTPTIGIVLVASRQPWQVVLVEARMTSGARATSSRPYLCASFVLPPDQRTSIRNLSFAQPNDRMPFSNAATRARPSRSSEAKFISTPTRRTRSPCAHTPTGHAAQPPPHLASGGPRGGGSFDDLVGAGE